MLSIFKNYTQKTEIEYFFKLKHMRVVCQLAIEKVIGVSRSEGMLTVITDTGQQTFSQWLL